MKIFDAHNWLRLNDLRVIKGKETPLKQGLSDYSDRLLALFKITEEF